MQRILKILDRNIMVILRIRKEMKIRSKRSLLKDILYLNHTVIKINLWTKILASNIK